MPSPSSATRSVRPPVPRAPPPCADRPRVYMSDEEVDALLRGVQISGSVRLAHPSLPSARSPCRLRESQLASSVHSVMEWTSSNEQSWRVRTNWSWLIRGNRRATAMNATMKVK